MARSLSLINKLRELQEKIEIAKRPVVIKACKKKDLDAFYEDAEEDKSKDYIVIVNED